LISLPRLPARILWRLGTGVAGIEILRRVESPAAGALAAYALSLLCLAVVWWREEGQGTRLLTYWAERRDRTGSRVGFWALFGACCLISTTLLGAVSSAIPWLVLRLALVLGLAWATVVFPNYLSGGQCRRPV
jgi:hypothetical protein